LGEGQCQNTTLSWTKVVVIMADWSSGIGQHREKFDEPMFIVADVNCNSDRR